jgi:hypothetical protein
MLQSADSARAVHDEARRRRDVRSRPRRHGPMRRKRETFAPDRHRRPGRSPVVRPIERASSRRGRLGARGGGCDSKPSGDEHGHHGRQPRRTRMVRRTPGPRCRSLSALRLPELVLRRGGNDSRRACRSPRHRASRRRQRRYARRAPGRLVVGRRAVRRERKGPRRRRRWRDGLQDVPRRRRITPEADRSRDSTNPSLRAAGGAAWKAHEGQQRAMR